MTGIPNDNQNINSINLQILHSLLIQGSINTSGYFDFLNIYTEKQNTCINSLDRPSLENLLQALAAAPVPDRSSVLAAFETAQPALFRRLYGDLITYFYSTPEAAERARGLADSAPREPRPDFDPSLLDAVIAYQPGKRRL